MHTQNYNQEETSPTAARDLLHEKWARQVVRFPDFSLDSVDYADLSAREQDLVRAIDRSLSRRFLTVHFLLRQKLSRRFETLHPAVRSALAVGAAQLLFFERIPAHAVINESVEWVKKRRGSGPAGMVNAVLRRLAESVSGKCENYDPTALDQVPLSDGSALLLEEKVLPTDPVDRIAVATSHPVSLCRHWLLRQKSTTVRQRCLHDLVHPPIVLNTRYTQTEQIPDAEPHLTPGCHVYRGKTDQLKSFLAEHRDVWVQDAASATALDVALDTKPGLILDLCAGKGTKTRQLQRMFPESSIVATDVDRKRLEILRQSFPADEQVRILNPPELRDYYGKADLILLDVPCSNSGVLARRPEARYRLTSGSLSGLRDLQRQITADALPLLRTGGQILYATCSLEEEENQMHAEWITRWHGMQVIRQSEVQPAGLPGEEPYHYRDGSFSVLMG